MKLPNPNTPLKQVKAKLDGLLASTVESAATVEAIRISLLRGYDSVARVLPHAVRERLRKR